MKKKLWIWLGAGAGVLVTAAGVLLGLYLLLPQAHRSLPAAPSAAPVALEQLSGHWMQVSGKQCYLLEERKIATGWAEINGQRYYFNPDGSMHTGWLALDGDRYYFKENGVMARGQVTLDDVNHFFMASGKYVVLVNHNIPVPADYEAQMVNLERIQISQAALDATKEMLAAARAEGHPCSMTSGYRSYYTQKAIWDRNVRTNMAAGYSYAEACRITSETVMTPGHSEHQTGLAIDFDNSQTGSIQWLHAHAWEYGFILRYPPDKMDKTGIVYEPWHYRYVGKELAKELYESGLCMEEYMEMLTEQSA